jgi:ketosteroid isomerase-like protein
MGVFDDLAKVVDQSHQALDQFVRGDSGALKALYSHRDDVSLANPFGPAVRGWAQVAASMDRAALNYRDGHSTHFDRVAEYTTADLACIVEEEHYEAKIGGSEDVTPVVLRVTTVLRHEDGGWKIVHRHADPITTARSAASVIRG